MGLGEVAAEIPLGVARARKGGLPFRSKDNIVPALM